MTDRDGTPEEAWQAWAGWRDLLPLPEPGGEVLVVSAHPDDEVLAVGGLLCRLSERGAPVRFVVATDGEGSHPGSSTRSPASLAARRRVEIAEALAALGFAGVGVTHLGLPDSGLADHAPTLESQLRPLVVDAHVVLCPWERDGHPDHDAVGRAVRSVAAPGTGVWEYPVWAWHWTGPEDARIPWHRARAFRLDDSCRAAKSRAIDAFESQVRPLSDDPVDAAMLPGEVLAHFDRDVEVVLV